MGAPYTGDDCSVQETGLTSGVPVEGRVQLNHWQYYNYTTDAAFVSVQLYETESAGSVWLFVDREQTPTLHEHDFQDVTFSSSLHTVNIRNGPGERSTYFIGVYGDPIMTSSSGRPFRLVV